MRAFETEKTEVAEIDRSVYDIKDKVNAAFEVNSGLTAEIVEQISKEKHDPDWMREFRLKALDIYNKASLPNWGPSLEGLDMRNIVTYVRPNTEMRGKWSEVPDDIKNTFERLGIPQAERSSLAGVGAQYDSEVVYHNVKEEVAAQGVVYTDMESALTGPYADAESFAADCIGIMQLAADKDLGFTSYRFSSGEDTDDGISYYLDCVVAYPEGLTAAQVARRVTESYHYDGSSFSSEADRDEYIKTRLRDDIAEEYANAHDDVYPDDDYVDAEVERRFNEQFGIATPESAAE